MKKGSILKEALVLLLLVAVSLFCFWDVLWLHFFSDDYHVVHRLTIDKIFWAPGFFRPLSDISLLFSYYTSGYNAFGYRLFNVLLHGINGFLLYHTLQHIFEFNDSRNKIASFIGSLLFVVYPFHTESIIWIVGRASLVANTFGILSLYFFFSKLPYKTRIALSCISLFIGLASYESILVIPGIIFLAVWYQRDFRKAVMTTLPYAATLVLHIVVRVYASGVFTGNYGKDMFGEGQTNYIAKFIKSFGRLFVPGLQSDVLLLVFFLIAFSCILLSFFIIYKYRNRYLHFYILLWLFLLVSHIIPTMFGVDTHTSDGDRLLYFPSYFLCGIIAWFIVVVVTNKQSRNGIAFLLVVVSVLLIKYNNRNWIKADAVMTVIFNNINNHCCKPLYLVNVPDAIEGSFVFRNGLYEALEIHRIPGDVRVINYLRNKDAVLLPDTIHPTASQGERLVLPPLVTATSTAFFIDTVVNNRPFTKAVKRDTSGVILFWNRNKVVTLLP